MLKGLEPSMLSAHPQMLLLGKFWCMVIIYIFGSLAFRNVKMAILGCQTARYIEASG